MPKRTSLSQALSSTSDIVLERRLVLHASLFIYFLTSDNKGVDNARVPAGERAMGLLAESKRLRTRATAPAPLRMRASIHPAWKKTKREGGKGGMRNNEEKGGGWSRSAPALFHAGRKAGGKSSVHPCEQCDDLPVTRNSSQGRDHRPQFSQAGRSAGRTDNASVCSMSTSFFPTEAAP